MASCIGTQRSTDLDYDLARLIKLLRGLDDLGSVIPVFVVRKTGEISRTRLKIHRETEFDSPCYRSWTKCDTLFLTGLLDGDSDNHWGEESKLSGVPALSLNAQ